MSTIGYHPCESYHTERDVGLAPGEPQIERGRDMAVLDGVGWVVGIPAKILLLNPRIDNHHVSPQTEQKLAEYLARNDLDKVKVRVNQYDPIGEWQRLAQNESVTGSLRYTIGTLSVLGYTLIPGRIVGGDHYNPFTNTISIYSDVSAIALYEGAHAKDYARRQYKGLYAMASIIPYVTGFFHGRRASRDVTGYLELNGTSEEIKEGYRSVLPKCALESAEPMAAVTSTATTFVPALLAGHVFGQVKAATVPERETPPSMVNQAGFFSPVETPNTNERVFTLHNFVE
jgi:hypothetical protein